MILMDYWQYQYHAKIKFSQCKNYTSAKYNTGIVFFTSLMSNHYFREKKWARIGCKMFARTYLYFLLLNLFTWPNFRGNSGQLQMWWWCDFRNMIFTIWYLPWTWLIWTIINVCGDKINKKPYILYNFLEVPLKIFNSRQTI